MSITTVYLTEAQKRALPKAAKKSGLRVAELIREGVSLALASNGPERSQAQAPPPESSAAPPVAPDPLLDVVTKPPLGEVGVTGTPIWSGQIWAEANPALRDYAGHGTPGSIEWGQWEKLERTDHAVASALGLVTAPLRDSTLEVEPAPEPEVKSAPTPEAPIVTEDAEGNDIEDVLANLDDGRPASFDRSTLPPPGAESDEAGADTVSPGAADDPEAVLEAMAGPTQNEAIASFVKDNLQKWMAPNWSMLAEQIAHYGLGYGFFLGEEVWATRPDSRVPGGVAWYIKRIAHRLPSSILQNGWREQGGELASILQAGTRDGVWHYNIELPASKCLLATWGRTGNNYMGYPAFRAAWYIGKQRADLLRILGIGSAREALGILSVEVEAGVTLSDPQRDALQDFIENAHAHEHLAIQMPPGCSLQWVTSASANKGNVLELWKALGLAIYETVQAQQTTLGTGETGSRSVGEVHDASRNAFVNGVRAWLEANLNGIGDQPYTGLVRKIVDANFGPQEEYPKVVISLKKPEISIDVFAAAVKTLSDAGCITVGIEDENDVRERLGWAPVDPAERAAEKARKAAIATAISGGDPEKAGPPESPPAGGGGPAGKGPPALSKPDPEAAQRAAAKLSEHRGFRPVRADAGLCECGHGKPMHDSDGCCGLETAKLGHPPCRCGVRMSEQPALFMPRRALRPAEQNCNLAEIDAFFDSGKDRFDASLKPVVEEMVRGSVEQVREAMKDGDPSELKGLRLPTKLLGKALEVFIENARAFGYRQARQELERQGARTLGADETATALPEALSAYLLDSTFEWLTPEDPEGKGRGGKTGRLRIAISDEDVANLVNAQAKMVTERISGRLKQQVWDKAVDSVRKGESADDAVQAVLDSLETSKALRGDAEVILSRSFGMGREQVFQEFFAAIEALEYSAVLDRSTCDECDRADGRRFAVNSPDHLAYLTPYAKCAGKSRCRCVHLPVAKAVAA